MLTDKFLVYNPEVVVDEIEKQIDEPIQTFTVENIEEIPIDINTDLVFDSILKPDRNADARITNINPVNFDSNRLDNTTVFSTTGYSTAANNTNFPEARLLLPKNNSSEKLDPHDIAPLTPSLNMIDMNASANVGPAIVNIEVTKQQDQTIENPSKHELADTILYIAKQREHHNTSKVKSYKQKQQPQAFQLLEAQQKQPHPPQHRQVKGHQATQTARNTII